MLRFRERDGEWHPGPFDFGAADRVIVGTKVIAAVRAQGRELPFAATLEAFKSDA